jgi:hypothetical protein
MKLTDLYLKAKYGEYEPSGSPKFYLKRRIDGLDYVAETAADSSKNAVNHFFYRVRNWFRGNNYKMPVNGPEFIDRVEQITEEQYKQLLRKSTTRQV